MNSEVFDFLKQSIALFWKLFTGWNVPGTNVTVGGWILFALSVGVLFRILAKFGFGSASIDDIKDSPSIIPDADRERGLSIWRGGKY